MHALGAPDDVREAVARRDSNVFAAVGAIAASLALVLGVASLVRAVHTRVWSPELGYWSGALYYAMWGIALAIAALLGERPRVLPDPARRTRRDVAVLAVVLVLSELMYGFPLVAVVTGRQPLHAPSEWAFLLNAMLWAPIVEEWLFRGVWWDVLERHGGPGLALAVTSIAFGPWHWTSWSSPSWWGSGGTFVLLHVAFGFLMGILKWRFRGVLPCVLVHGLWNTSAAIVW